MPDMKDRKGKKNKKKQAMSQPIDLEAGDHVAEPETPSIAKAVYDKASDDDIAKAKTETEPPGSSGTNLSKDDATVDISASVAGKSSTKNTQKTPIPPLPKTKNKAKIQATEAVNEVTNGRDTQLKLDHAVTVPDIIVTQADSPDPATQEASGKNGGDIEKSVPLPSKANSRGPENEEVISSIRCGEFGLEVVQSAASDVEASTPKADEQKKLSSDLTNVTGVPGPSHNEAKVKINGRKTANDFLRANSAASNPMDTNSSKAESSKGVSKAKLQLMPLVSEISINPQPPMTQTENFKLGRKQKLRLCPLISAWSIAPSNAPTATQSAQSSTRSTGQQQKPVNTSQLPALPPFDHESFSRFDNTRQLTNK